MPYYSLSQILGIHLLMGIGFGIVVAAHAQYRGRPRRLLTFGGDVFSLGDSHRWLRWYVLAFAFEFASSLLVPSGARYLEMSLSVVEAAMIVVGAYLVDRALLLVEFGPASVLPDVRPRRASFRERLDARRAAASTQAADRRAADRRAFEQATKGK